MTTKVPLLSERMLGRGRSHTCVTHKHLPCAGCVSLEDAAEVAALEQKVQLFHRVVGERDTLSAKVDALERQLEQGVEGLVPPGWTLAEVAQIPGGRIVGGNNYYEVYLRHYDAEGYQSRVGTGPTVEAAIKDAASKVTK